MNWTVSIVDYFSRLIFEYLHFCCTEKIQKLLLIREEFDKFIETTENSQAKIDESVATLLYVVKKESDTIIRKKSAIGAQMQWK